MKHHAHRAREAQDPAAGSCEEHDRLWRWLRPDRLRQFVASLPRLGQSALGRVIDFFRSLPGKIRDVAGRAKGFIESLDDMGESILNSIPSFKRLQEAIDSLFKAFPPAKGGGGGPAPVDPRALPLTPAERRRREREIRRLDREIREREKGNRGIRQRALRETAEEVRRLRREGREVRPSDRRRIFREKFDELVEKETKELREERDRLRRSLEEDRRIRAARRRRRGRADAPLALGGGPPLDFTATGAGTNDLRQITGAAKQQAQSADRQADTVRQLRGDLREILVALNQGIAALTGAEARLAGAGGRVT